MLASAVTLSVVSRSLSVDFLGCKIIEMLLSWLWFEVARESLVSRVSIHIGNGSFAEAVEIDGRAPEPASPEIGFFYLGEFAENFLSRGSFESFCYIFWSIGSSINGEVNMVLVESNFSEDPSMFFTDFSENLFAAFLQLRKVKDVVTVFGFEAQVQNISSDT